MSAVAVKNFFGSAGSSARKSLWRRHKQLMKKDYSVGSSSGPTVAASALATPGARHRDWLRRVVRRAK